MNESIFRAMMQKAEKYYLHCDLQYHNLIHANRVVSTCYKLREICSGALLLAAQWHDAVYIPGSKVNEQASADLLLHNFKLWATSSMYNTSEERDVINTAMSLIKSTRVEDHMMSYSAGDTELGTLLDADLVSLADNYITFVETQKRILSEHGEIKLSHSAKFLKQLKDSREYIYHTTKGREMFEDAAQRNIAMLIAENP
jgi:predicted metal-dependent HD superfamily phosphohydrolase